MRASAILALVVGAAGSIGLMLHAKQHPPPLLVVLFVIWVLSPFAALGAAYRISKRWASGTQTTLHVVTVFIALASLLIYGDDAVNHRAAHPAFVYVAVPPASWLLGVIALLIAALRARRV
jgi:hypothetical protein